MSTHYLLAATLAMTLVTFITRALPALVPRRWLYTPWLHRLNESLPLSVLVLLILTSLAYPTLAPTTGSSWQELWSLTNPEVQMLLAQVVALLVVLLVYHVSRQLLISMVVGIAAINAVLWLL